jgi:hypothetical protein
MIQTSQSQKRSKGGYDAFCRFIHGIFFLFLFALPRHVHQNFSMLIQRAGRN